MVSTWTVKGVDVILLLPTFFLLTGKQVYVIVHCVLVHRCTEDNNTDLLWRITQPCLPGRRRRSVDNNRMTACSQSQVARTGPTNDS